MSSHIAACHVHSEWSYDAEWTLGEIAEAFHFRGCSVVLMSEHDRGWSDAKWKEYCEACRAASRDGMLLVPGIEYSDPRNDVHTLVWGAHDFLGEGLETTELLNRVERAGGSAVLAHPERHEAWRLFQPEWFDRILGVEVWNRKTDGWAPSQRGLALWRHSGVAPFASLDFHRKNQFFPLRMRLECAEILSVESVFAALAAGNVAPEYRGNALIPLVKPGSLRGLRILEVLRRILRWSHPRSWAPRSANRYNHRSL